MTEADRNPELTELLLHLESLNLVECGVSSVTPCSSSDAEYIPHNIDLIVDLENGNSLRVTCLSLDGVRSHLSTRPYFVSQYRTVLTNTNSKEEIVLAVTDLARWANVGRLY